MIYLDNAATTFPKPASVGRKMLESLENYSANAGRGAHALAMKSAAEIYAVRKSAAAFFHIESPSNVIFTQNATMALNIAIKGVLKSGDHALISDLEHNSVLRPVYETCEFEIFNSNNALQSISDKIRPKTRAVICTAVSNVTGKALPVADICRLCRNKGIISIIDASQAAGTAPLFADEIPFDFLCTAGHKGLYGPQGTGLLISNCEIPLKPLLSGGSGNMSTLPVQPHDLPERLEAGTLNLHGIVGLGAGIDFAARINSTHERALISRLNDGLLRMQRVKIIGAGDTLLSFNIDAIQSEALAAMYDKNGVCVRAGLHCSPLAHKKAGTFPHGTVRVSVGSFNTVAQIDRFLDMTEHFCAKTV